MRLSEAAKVGITTLVALALLAFATFSLRSTLQKGKSYTRDVMFPNAQGIQEGAFVRVRGVDLGNVERVMLDPAGNAVLRLRLSDRYKVKAADSIRIVGGLFGFSPPFVEITPNAATASVSPEPEVLTGLAGPSSDDVMAKSDELLTNVNQLAERMNLLAGNLNEMVGDKKMRQSFTRTASNFEKVSESGVKIAKNMEHATGRVEGLMDNLQTTSSQVNRTLKRTENLMSSFQGTAAESRELMRDTRGLVQDTRSTVREMSGVVKSTGTVVENAGGLVTDTRAVLGENRERLKTVLERVDSTLKQLEGTLTETRSFLGDTELRADLKATAKNVRDATEGLKKITDDVRVITGDKEVQQDLKQSLSRLNEVSAQASDLIRRVEAVVGSGGKTAKSLGERVADAELRTEITRGFSSNRTRIDFNATIPWSQNTYYRLGFFDFGEQNNFNVQAGQQLRPGIWTRYGVHASKLGVGLDLGSRQRPPLTLDLYGVDSPRLDVHGFVPLRSGFDLTLGINNLAKRADPVFGLRYSR
ncbi:MAG: ABC-type transport system involved in resistance to organic solvent, periplasmic component [Armatimonadetes bacterium]|jgi:ABC-type transporter Mla subunit MlaD|nr:ABC-type transport system involved in resistance to organic solvent, periplasmic component [Armatimonadota bacterium]